MVVGFRVTAAFVIFVFTLNWFGIIDVRDFEDFTMNYRVGVYGIDGRVIDPLADTGQKVHAYPFVAHAMPLLLGMEALAAPWAAALIVSALLFVAQRGLIFGGILTILVTTTLAGGRETQEAQKCSYFRGAINSSSDGKQRAGIPANRYFLRAIN